MNTDTARLKAILLFAATLAFVVAPLFTGFNGFEPQAFPIPQVSPPVQPAGYAFSIWTLIYVWLLVHAVWGLFMRADDPDWDRPRWPLLASVALGASWLTVANFAPVIATVQIWVMLLLALAALFLTSPERERWLLTTPVALYAGWLTAASWVSIGLLLGGYAITGETAAAFIGIAGAAATSLTVQARLGRAPEYGLAVIWGLIGIVVTNLGPQPLVAAFAALGVVALGVVAWRAAQPGRASDVAS
jgi:hypothetical protein